MRGKDSLIDCNVNTFTFHKIEISLLLSNNKDIAFKHDEQEKGRIYWIRTLFSNYENIMFHLFSATAVRMPVGEIGEAESQSLLEKFSRKT